MSLFPLIDAPDTGTVPTATLPLAREIAWDFVQDQPIWRAGSPVYVTGADAVLVWAWNCIHTKRFRYDVFTTDYGQDLSGLVGQPYGDEIRQSEAIRTIREALMIHPIYHRCRSGKRPIRGNTAYPQLYNAHYLWGGSDP